MRASLTVVRLFRRPSSADIWLNPRSFHARPSGRSRPTHEPVRRTTPSTEVVNSSLPGQRKKDVPTRKYPRGITRDPPCFDNTLLSITDGRRKALTSVRVCACRNQGMRRRRSFSKGRDWIVPRIGGVVQQKCRPDREYESATSAQRLWGDDSSFCHRRANLFASNPRRAMSLAPSPNASAIATTIPATRWQTNHSADFPTALFQRDHYLSRASPEHALRLLYKRAAGQEHVTAASKCAAETIRLTAPPAQDRTIPAATRWGYRQRIADPFRRFRK